MAPKCPCCGSEMVQRVARRGRNAGGKFWGCSAYPKCKCTRDISGLPEDRGVEDGSESTSRPPEKGSVPDSVRRFRPVPWEDPPGFSGRFRVFPGSGRRKMDKKSVVTWNHFTLVGQSSVRGCSPAHPASLTAIYLAIRLFLRGEAPPLPRYVAEELPESAATSDSADPASPIWSSPHGSEEEESFFCRWLPRHAPRWVLPFVHVQVPLYCLGSGSVFDRQSVDFAIMVPRSDRRVIVIEIDGMQHHDKAQASIDAVRSEALKSAGHRVIRIPASEVRKGCGNALSKLEATLSSLDRPRR